MGKELTLTKDFVTWALPKLRPLVDAHREDAAKGVKRKGAFYRLLEQYIDEYKAQPFAKPDHEGNPRKEDGTTLSFDELKTASARWLRNHSDLKKLATLEKYEEGGGRSEDGPQRRGTAELWAAVPANKQCLRDATLAELGLTDPVAQLPSDYLGTRKVVLKRLFQELPENERSEWATLAQLRREQDEAHSTLPSVVQDRQDGMVQWFNERVQDKIKGGGLGQIFVVTMQGFYRGEEDKKVHRFRAYHSSLPQAQPWFDTTSYKDGVHRLWHEYVDSTVGNQFCPELPPLPDVTTGEEMQRLRRELKEHLEDLYIISAQIPRLNREKFWAEVAREPNEFVTPTRVPEGVTFRNPEQMAEQQFRLLYRHVRQCQIKRTKVEDELRFGYHQPAIARAMDEYSARRKHMEIEKRRSEKETTAVPTEAPSGPETGPILPAAPLLPAMEHNRSREQPTSTPPAAAADAEPDVLPLSEIHVQPVVDGGVPDAEPAPAQATSTRGGRGRGGSRGRGGGRGRGAGRGRGGAAVAVPPGPVDPDHADVAELNTGKTSGRKRKNPDSAPEGIPTPPAKKKVIDPSDAPSARTRHRAERKPPVPPKAPVKSKRKK